MAHKVSPSNRFVVLESLVSKIVGNHFPGKKVVVEYESYDHDNRYYDAPVLKIVNPGIFSRTVAVILPGYCNKAETGSCRIEKGSGNNLPFNVLEQAILESGYDIGK